METGGGWHHHLRLVTPPSSRRLMVEDGMQRESETGLSVLSDREVGPVHELASPATIYSLPMPFFNFAR